MSQPAHAPAKLFRLPYAAEFYLCTCAATLQPDCVCDQETVVTTHRNSHLVEPALVQWLSSMRGPFTIDQAIDAMGMTEIAAASSNHHTAVAIDMAIQLGRCGATLSREGRTFISPSAETLSGLHLRRPECSQSPSELQKPSPESPVPHPGLSPASHADRQSAPADLSVDQQSPRQSV